MLLLKNISLKAEIIMFLNSLKILFIFTKKIKNKSSVRKSVFLNVIYFVTNLTQRDHTHACLLAVLPHSGE